MIQPDVFTIDMSGARKTRSDYAKLGTYEILRLINLAVVDRTHADTDEELFDAEFALQELRAVLQERQ